MVSICIEKLGHVYGVYNVNNVKLMFMFLSYLYTYLIFIYNITKFALSKYNMRILAYVI